MLRVCKALQKGKEAPSQLQVFPPRLPKRREVRLPCCQRARAGRMGLWMLIPSQPVLCSR